MIAMERSCNKEYICQISKLYLLQYKSYGQSLSFSKVGQSSRHIFKIMVPMQRDVRNTYAKYECPVAWSEKVMGNIKV